jgi:plasmid stability protein
VEDHPLANLTVKNLPDPLYKKLKVRARAHHRSVAQEITHLLTALLEEPEPLSILELRGLGQEAWTSVDPDQHVVEERDSWD